MEGIKTTIEYEIDGEKWDAQESRYINECINDVCTLMSEK